MALHQFLSRSLVLLVATSLTIGCHVTVHNHGQSAAKAPKGASGSAPPKDGQPKGEPPEVKDRQPGKPKPEKQGKPKGDQPKGNQSKPSKPKQDKPKANKPDKPAPDVPSEPPPPAGVSRLSVPVRAPFEEIVARVDALLPKTQSEDWKRMGKEGDSTVLDVKYTVWRDTIDASFKGKTLTIVVPVRYAAKLRGKVKNPLGGDYLPLNDGQTWGTKASPQRLRLTIELELDVSDEWKLVSVAKLDEIEHGPAPKGNFCAHAGIDLCTPKASFAGEVHQNIERYLSPRIMKELERAERELEKNLDLHAKASALWAAVQKPLTLQKAGDEGCATVLFASCKKEAWLSLEPTGIGLSEISLVDGDFGIDVGLEGKLSVVTDKKPKAGKAKLPKPARLPGSTFFQVSARLDVPTAVFERAIERELPSLLGKQKDSPKPKVRVRASKGQLEIEIETKGGSLVMVAVPVFDEKKGELRAEEVTFEPDTKKLLDQQGIDGGKLAELVRKAIFIPVAKEAKVLRRAIPRAMDRALPGQLEVKGSLDELDFQGAEVEAGDGVHVRVEVRGRLSLEYVP